MKRAVIVQTVAAICLACASACAMEAPAPPSARVRFTVDLKPNAPSDVEIVIHTDPGRAAALVGYLQKVEGDEPLVEMLLAQTQELRTMVERAGLSAVKVTQESLNEESQRTTVTGRIDNLRAFKLLGEVRFARENSSMALTGTMGGRRALDGVDLSPLAQVMVHATFKFPGSVEVRDNLGTRSHTGRSVSYAWTARELLGRATEVNVHVTPDLEGDPWFWLVLILVVTALVVLGALIVLQKGADAVKPAGDA